MAVLVLDAGDPGAITVVCVQAGESEREDIGGRTRAFAGNLRVSTRAQKRSFPVVTRLLSAAERQAILALIANNAIIPCTGDLLDGATFDCSVKCTGWEMNPSTNLFRMSLTVTQV